MATAQNIDILINFKSNTSSLNTGVGQVNKSMGGLTASLGKLPQLLATAFAVDKIVDFGKTAVDTFANFEQAMASVKAKTGATGEEFTRLNTLAKELGRTTTKTASDVANAMTVMAGGGLSVDEIETGIGTIISIAEAGGTDVESSAEKIMTAMNVYGLEVNKMSAFMDRLANIDNKAQGSFLNYLDTYQVAGSTLKSFNINMDESIALIGAMAKQGDLGAELGNSINSIFVNLMGTSGQAKTALEELNISLFDKQGNKRSPIEVLRDLSKVLGESNTELTAQQKETYQAMIAGKTQLTQFQHMMSAISEGTFDELQEYAKNSDGALSELVKIQNDTLQGRFAGLSSAWEGLLIEIGDTINVVLGPAIEALTDMLIKLTNPLAEWNNKRNQAKQNATTSSDDSVIKVLEEDYADAFKEWIKQDKGSKYYGKKLEKVDDSSYLSSGDNWFKNNIKIPLGDGFSKLSDSLPKLMEGFTKFMDKAQPGLEKIWEIIKSIGKSVSEVWAKYGQFVMEQMSRGIDLISSALPHIGVIFTDVINVISNIWENIGIPIFDAIIVLIEGFRHAWEEAFPLIQFLWEGFWNNLSNFWHSVVTPWLNGIIYFISGVITGDWAKAWDGLRLICDGVWNAIILMAERTCNGVIGVINWLISKWNELFSLQLPDWLGGGSAQIFQIGEVGDADFSGLLLANDYSDEYKQANWNNDNYAKEQITKGTPIWNAQGGIFQKPTLLGGNQGVGEVGAEAVIPLTRLERMVNNPTKVELKINNFNNYSDNDLDEIIDYIDSAIAQKSELTRRNNGGIGR